MNRLTLAIAFFLVGCSQHAKTNDELMQDYLNDPATQQLEKASQEVRDMRMKGVHPDDAPKQFGDFKKQKKE